METRFEPAAASPSTPPPGNRLIDALPPADRMRLADAFVREELRLADTLFEQGMPTHKVVFPLSGVASLLAVTADGDMVEVATVGNEGMIGLHLLFGLEEDWVARAIQQIPGEGLAMSAERFREECRREGPFRDALLLYAKALFAQVSQCAACNRLHPLEQRCARWLLMCRDRAASDHFKLTHDFLADMLGVRRPSVTIALGVLQQAGLISTRRGHIAIVDGEKLEEASCGCYQAIRTEYERTLPGPAARIA